MAAYLLGVDIGTQGTKVILFDAQMNLVADGFEASNLISPKPGVVWQEADDIIGSVARTIRQAIEKAGIDAKQIAAACVDGQMAGIMGVDKQGNAATYYDSWLDTRCNKQMKQMRERAGKRVTEITGGPITYTHGPKILWWKEEQREAYDKIYKFVLPHGFVTMQMCGLSGDEAYFDYTCLQYSGFGDNLNKQWSDELLATFDIAKDKMARIASPFEIVGKVCKQFAQQSGMAEGTPVVAGMGDTASSVFGSGMVQRGMVQDIAGTASVLCCVVDAYQPDTEFETMTMMRSPIDGTWFPLAYINGGGMCVRWFRDNFTGNPAASYDELQAEAQRVDAGSEGVIFVPHFAGRVLPQNPYVKGSFVGLDWKHTRGHLYRAVLEGIGYEYAYYYDVLKKLFPDVSFERLYSLGGGAKSALFSQIKADILGIPVSTFAMGETALVGDAAVAGTAVGIFEDCTKPLAQAMQENRRFAPDENKHAIYRPFAMEYRNVIRALESVYKSGVYGIE